MTDSKPVGLQTNSDISEIEELAGGDI
jgi:hypothetical protein